MESKVVFANALEAQGARGWFIGHFISPTGDPRSTSAVEVKWGAHQAGESRSEWATNLEATTLSILIEGRFRIHFPEGEVLLSRPGDYALWCPGVPHSWAAELDSTVLTVRWPSKPGDSCRQGIGEGR
ncbi:hypothetical protein [Kamptonema formosum]|uniref:hypothetical protein n=1 Tax=Kamptonema formosum TaxID=331992 RepID=UPI00034BD843|nr:hypothetical protein [Oscillatoria sp. PCC 10802]